MILFHLQTLGAGRHVPSFFYFLNDKILINIYTVYIFLNVTFFRLCCVFRTVNYYY